MSDNYHIVSVPLKELYDSKQGKILYLGKWCSKIIKKKTKFKILKYPWTNKKNKIKSYRNIRDDYFFLKNYLKNYLNKIHNTTYSLKYWEQILGHWLINFVSIVNEKKEIIKNINSYNVKSYTFLSLEKESYIPRDNYHAAMLFQNDYWNGFLYSILLRQIRPDIFFKTKQLDIINRNNYKKKINLKLFFLKIFFKLLSKFQPKTDKFIINSYLGIFNELKLQLYTNKILQLNFDYELKEDSPINSENRHLLIEKKLKKNSKELLKILVLMFLPKSYLEDYKDYELFIKKKVYWSKKPKIIFTSNSHLENDVFKIWLAKLRENKSKLIVGQHGSGYLFPKYHTNFDRDVDTCDKFLFWGNKKFKNKKIVGNFNLISTSRNFYRTDKKHILMVQNFPNKYQNKLISTEHSLSDIDLNIKLQQKFISLLQNKVKNKISIRLGSYSKYDNEILSYEESFWKNREKLKIENRNIPFYDSLKKSILVTVNSLSSTVFMECLQYNIPCFIISFFHKEMFRDECFNDFLILKKIGIIQDNPRNFANFLNKEFNSIQLWWNNEKIQKSLAKFNYNYNASTKSPIKDLDVKLN